LEKEHKELSKDIVNLFLNFTILLGPLATMAFVRKWFFKKPEPKQEQSI
jgi:hypothetical protein